MKIDLSQKIGEHFQRLERLAMEAEGDVEEKYSSRAAAMTALTSMLKELTKVQEAVVNMERLMRVESATKDVLNKYLTDEQKEDFLDDLEQKLGTIN